VRFFNATDAAIIDSTIGGNGPGTWPDRSDWHGIQVLGASNRVLIQGLISSNNHGDSVQCNFEYTPAAQTPRNVTVSGGVLRDDHENAVDIKRCDGVTVQSVRMIGYRPAPGHADRHAAIVVHFGAGGLLLHGNRISESSVGIRIGPGRQNGNVHEVGAAVVRRNTIYESCPTTVPPSMSPAVCRGAGIDAAAHQLDVYHNTIARLRGQTGTGRGAGIRIGAGADNATTYQRALVVNNLIQDLAPGKRTAVVTAQLPPNRLNAGRNLYLQASAPAAPWPAQNDVVSMAAILQAPTFLPTTTSPAYNGARVLAAAQQAPVCFGAPDIGATERCP
jgi:hypothetical protein